MVRRPTILFLLMLGAPLAAFVVLSLAGPPGVLAAAAAVIASLSVAAWPALLYLLGAIGLGRLFARVAGRPSICAALGLGVMLTVSHLLGVLGLFDGPAGPYVAMAPVAAGLGLLLMRKGAAEESGAMPAAVWLGLLALAAAPVAIACNPPGWLWGSEFGGYDALSYHLQLPQEWLAMGRIAPVDHNVYSYLPGYMEAAYTHLGAMTFAPLAAHGSDPLDVPAWGLVAGSGWRLLSCQLLHAGCGLLAGWCIAGACVSGRAPEDSGEDRVAGAAACMLALATPWTVVTASLAYNEMPMLALFAGACAAALAVEMVPMRRWCIAAALIGAAACVKPTAIVLCGGPVALLLMATTPVRRWALPALAGAGLGLVILSPWLIRNYMVCGNPVFPFAAGLFPNADGGTGHWTAEQVARYHAGHTFTGSLWSRLALMVVPDETDPAGPRMRGLLHPQWFALFPGALVCLAICLIKRVRGAALWGGALALTIVLWLFTTHVQSRFLIPALVPACALLALAWSGGGKTVRRALAVLILAQAGATLVIHGQQRQGSPSLFIDVGPAYRSAEWAREQLRIATGSERREWLRQAPPEMYCNLALPPGVTIRMVGGATPLYYSRAIAYNTTWDAWPIAEIVAGRSPADTDYLLIDFAEIGRLASSGWMSPGFTPEALADWLRANTDEVKSWPEIGVVLVKVREGAGR